MRLLLIDGNSILNRAFYGIKLLSTSRGFYTNAITGFMNIFLKEREIVKPDSVACAFDLKGPTFRHEKCAYYKAKRKPMPEELAMQLPKLREILSAMGIPVLELKGYEADDILGSVSALVAKNGGECVLLTGDRDSLQLIGEGVSVRLVTNKETIPFDEARFYSEYGTRPQALIDIKALMGDSSDNIPGVPGIGEKTALSLIREYGSIDGLYDSLGEAKLTPSVRAKLINGRASAYESRWLATIVRDAPVPQDMAGYSCTEADQRLLSGLLTELEMFKLLERLGLEASSKPQAAKESHGENKALEPVCALDLDKSQLDIIDGESYFILDGAQLQIFYDGRVYYTEEEGLILAYFKKDCKKSAYEAKSAHKLAMKNGASLTGLEFACDIAGYLLNSQAGDYTLESLMASFGVFPDLKSRFGAAAALPELCRILRISLDEACLDKLYYDIELPLCEVLASMEVVGVRADSEGIKSFGEGLDGEIDRLRQEIYGVCGHEFNISSPKQLGEVLFGELGLPSGKKTKSGYSTSAEVLEALTDVHPVIGLVLEYRTLTKLKSTYVEGLLPLIDPDGRVRSEFKQTETRTGRISSANPNMQNIPVRKELGSQLRRFFTAAPGKLLIDADYSQIELRVLASVCGDERMISTFHSGKDIHTKTAAEVFGVPEEFVDHDMRRAAKAVNFGIIYGIGAYSLAKDLRAMNIGVSVAEADRYIKSYLETYPAVDSFMKSTVQFAEENGYVKTVFGRRRYIPELKSSNRNLQAFGKRAAMNAPIQGAAADIIKLAMVKVYRSLKEEGLDARLILQVHDELIVEASAESADKAQELLKREMESAASLRVPLLVELGRGKSWLEAKE